MLTLFAMALSALFSVECSRAEMLNKFLLNMAVLISIPKSNVVHYGTGFYGHSSNTIYFITAAHVLFDVGGGHPTNLVGTTAKFSSCSPGFGDDRCEYSAALDELRSAGDIKRHPERDVALIKIGTILNTASGAEGSCRFSPHFKRLSQSESIPVVFGLDNKQACVTFDDAELATEGFVFGYPVSLIVRNVFEDIDLEQPVVKKTMLSQKNRKTRRLIMDSAVYPGNSGGPAILVETLGGGKMYGRIAGIVIKYVPVITAAQPQAGLHGALVNSGYSVVEPSDYIFDVIKEFK
jgi:hypothetical protein